MKRFLCLLILALFLCSCSSKKSRQAVPIQTISEGEKNHSWYYFTSTGFLGVDKPQNVPSVYERPWTESVRISSARTMPGTKNAYAVVNRLGMLELTAGEIKLYSENSLFAENTADSIVFSDGTPVFYLYKSTFFNQDMLSSSVASGGSETLVQYPDLARPFLIEFNTQSKSMYPLVSYANINLTNKDQITGIFWNGKTWACSAKRMEGSGVEFTYFKWEPLVPLTELSPALSKEVFVFTESNAAEYRAINTPALFKDAPQEIQKLLQSLPSSYSFYITVSDGSGTSPRSYFHEGNGEETSNAFAATKDNCGFTVALFPDGTTYIAYQKDEKDAVGAFRLPLLPAGFQYGEFAVAGNIMYIAWEESSFYKTGRSGFLTVDLKKILNLDDIG